MSFRLKSGFLSAYFALLPHPPLASAEILFRDTGTYIINGFNAPAAASGGQWFDGPTLRYIVLPYPLAVGTNVTIQLTVSDLSLGSAGVGTTVFSLDAFDDIDYIPNAGSISSAYVDGNLSLTLSVSSTPLGSNPVMRATFSQSTTWAANSYVVLSDVCIFIGTSCTSGPSAAATLASMQRNSAALRNAFNLQSAKMAQGLSYDCSLFDAKNICVSFAGTRSDGKGGLDDTRGALIVAHKPNANVRFGGYIDQSFNSSESGGLKVKHSSPGYGVFAVWSEKADGSGLQVRGSASFGKADMESTRSEVGTAEAGFGKSDIKSDGFQIEASRDYAVNAMWSARPYVGFRQLTNRRASYTETDAVDFPLSYSSIKQSTQSLLAGVRFAHTISAQTTMTVAAGLEHDIKNDVDRYEASEASIGDIDSIDMEDGKKNTRPTLSLGLTHVIDKAQRIGVSITHRKEAFESGSTTSGMVQYSRGF